MSVGRLFYGISLEGRGILKQLIETFQNPDSLHFTAKICTVKIPCFLYK